MSAAEVLAQSSWQTYAATVGRSLPEGLADEIAAHQLDALKADGFAVIDATGGYGDRQALMEDFGFAVNRNMPGGLVIATLENEEVVALHSVRHARQMAAAWTAVADVAEAVR